MVEAKDIPLSRQEFVKELFNPVYKKGQVAASSEPQFYTPKDEDVEAMALEMQASAQSCFTSIQKWCGSSNREALSLFNSSIQNEA